MDKRESRLFKKVGPILRRFAKEWFPAYEKSPEGHYYYCGYCDMECGRNKNHDKDCLLEISKRAVDKFESIDNDKKYNFDYKQKKLSKSASSELKLSSKVRYLLTYVYPTFLPHLTPLDYRVPENKTTICTCNKIQSMTNNKWKKTGLRHAKDCPNIGLANALSEYLYSKN